MHKIHFIETAFPIKYIYYLQLNCTEGSTGVSPRSGPPTWPGPACSAPGAPAWCAARGASPRQSSGSRDKSDRGVSEISR